MDLDHPAWRAAEKVVRAGTRQGSRLASWRRRAAVAWWLNASSGEDTIRSAESRHPRVRELAALWARAGRAGDPGATRWRVAELRLLQQAGAYDLAARQADRLLGELDRMDAGARRAALPVMLELMLAIGACPRAREIAAGRRGDLEASAAGQTLLEILDLLEPQAQLPGGALDAVGLARSIEAGHLSGDDLLALLERHRAALLRNPELHLLLASAWRSTAPERAIAALDRFLRARSLPRCTRPGRSDNILRDLRFAAPRPSRPGPRVSVIVPAHDAAATIGYAVDSMLAQSYPDIEVLVADDASTDGTLDLLRQRYRAEARVRLFSSAVNQGAYNLRNQLAGHARGELLAFHDADDLALPTRLANQVRALDRSDGVACYACWLRVDADGRFYFFRDQTATRLCMASLVIPRRRFQEIGGFRSARFGADLELAERLRDRHGETAVPIVREPLIFGLWSQASATQRPGFEAHHDGYRAPGRRIYSELVFRQLLHGTEVVGDEDIARALRDSGNWAEPAPVTEIDRPAAL